ncbi:MAG: glycosyltransferase [Methylacidiphilales bacterium]|nr:glycosyltransferase [Candidatus Methylacidiphilales bacterium]
MKVVSILIPCYNAERWVGQAIESALGQTWPEKEVIVVNDGSTDGSLAVIQSFGDRICWETGPNRGGNVARNRLLELARGEWLQYLDADDYLLAGKVAQQMEFLATHPDTDLVFGPNTREYWSEKEIRRELAPIPEPHDPWELLGRGHLPQTGAPLWRKKSLLEVGGWKPDQPCFQEYELYLRLLMAGKQLTYCPHNGSVYRQWSEQTVYNRDKAEARRQCLLIAQRAESFLKEHNVLNAPRRRAINQGRFDAARSAWSHDHAEALGIMEIIHRSDPGFQPAGITAPARYRIVYRALGFRATEILAGWLRQFLTPSSG